MTMGKRIAERRKMLGISQEGLGEKLGVSRQAISKWEADAAMPEIDKLIALSKLFGVTVGWLLGIEEVTGTASDGISQEQMKTIEELIRRYSQPKQEPKPDRKRIALAACAICLSAISLCMSLSNLWNNNNLFPNYDSQLNNLLRENSDIQSQLDDLTSQVQELAEGEKLVTEFEMDVVAWDDYKGATVHFSAVPKTVRPEDTVYLAVFLDGEEYTAVPCERGALGHTASIDLPAADGYTYYIQVVHSDGTQEQNLLVSEETAGDTTPVYLESLLMCSAGMDIIDWNYTRGNLEVFPFVHADAPSLKAENDWPAWQRLELVLLHNGKEISRQDFLDKARTWMDENVEEVVVVPDIPEEKYMQTLWVDGDLGVLTYKLSNLAEGDKLELKIEAELSNGLTAESTGITWKYQEGTLEEAH